MTVIDRTFMKRALALARRGIGRVSPNPPVGAVIVRDGRVIGEGFHRRYGGHHAEIEALSASTGNVSGATMYVTLEPCSHHGKTPPCADAIIAARIGRVVAGVADMNPKVGGRGIARLREAGITVDMEPLGSRLEEFYRPFFTYLRTGRPFVTLKVAQSLDGRNSARRGTRYLLSEPALKMVHRMRYESDAILVGVDTVLRDDPRLDVRFGRKRPVTKVVLDSRGRLGPDARLFSTPGDVIMYTACTQHGLHDRMPATIITVPEDPNGHVDMAAVLDDLGRRGIVSLLVEGGTRLSFSLVETGMVDRVALFMAPIILGGGDFLSFGGGGFDSIGEALTLRDVTVRTAGADLLVTGYAK